MKQYKKYPGKLLQIRLSEKEYDQVISFIKTFGVTRREFILAVLNELKHNKVIKNGYFFESLRQYAYNFGEYRSKKKDMCELCDDRYRYKSSDHDIIGHHYLGYEEENINKVKWLCRRCHGFVHRRVCEKMNWEEIEDHHKFWDGRTAEEEMFDNKK